MPKRRIFDKLLGEVNLLISPDFAKLEAFRGANREWASKYLCNIIKSSAGLNDIQQEIELLLERLGVTSKGLLITIHSLEELI